MENEELNRIVELNKDRIERLVELGVLFDGEDFTRTYNVGKSDYSDHLLEPYSIWMDYNLNPWDADIVKRVLRNKEGEDRETDYRKIIHICKERLRQLKFSKCQEEPISGIRYTCKNILDEKSNFELLGGENVKRRMEELYGEGKKNEG